MFSQQAIRLWIDVWRSRALYLMLLPGLVYFAVYKYLPMYGVTIAFKDYDIMGGAAVEPLGGSVEQRRPSSPPACRSFSCIRTFGSTLRAPSTLEAASCRINGFCIARRERIGESSRFSASVRRRLWRSPGGRDAANAAFRARPQRRRFIKSTRKGDDAGRQGAIGNCLQAHTRS